MKHDLPPRFGASRGVLWFLTWLLNRRHFDRGMEFWHACAAQHMLVDWMNERS